MKRKIGYYSVIAMGVRLVSVPREKVVFRYQKREFCFVTENDLPGFLKQNPRATVYKRLCGWFTFYIEDEYDVIMFVGYKGLHSCSIRVPCEYEFTRISKRGRRHLKRRVEAVINRKKKQDIF